MKKYPRWIITKEFCYCGKEMELLGVEVNEEGTAILTHHKCKCGQPMSFIYQGKTVVSDYRKAMNENLGTQYASYERPELEVE